MSMIFDVFTLHTKIMLALLPPRAARYIGYCKHSAFSKITALTTSSLPCEYHGGHYTNDDASVCIFKYMVLPSLLDS